MTNAKGVWDSVRPQLTEKEMEGLQQITNNFLQWRNDSQAMHLKQLSAAARNREIDLQGREV